MNELKVKIEVEKKFVVPQLHKIDMYFNGIEHCIINDRFVNKDCGGIQCSDCICNINNMEILANSQNLQLL